jgi:hypothetical protein
VSLVDLQEIKRYDDSIWLYILKQRTVFDTGNIKAQKDWLIKALEVHQKAIGLALETLENNNLMNDDYYKIQAMLDEI